MVNEHPYPPSWVDRFQGWLYRLPIPIWLSVVLIYLLAVFFSISPFGWMEESPLVHWMASRC